MNIKSFFRKLFSRSQTECSGPKLSQFYVEDEAKAIMAEYITQRGLPSTILKNCVFFHAYHDNLQLRLGVERIAMESTDLGQDRYGISDESADRLRSALKDTLQKFLDGYQHLIQYADTIPMVSSVSIHHTARSLDKVNTDRIPDAELMLSLNAAEMYCNHLKNRGDCQHLDDYRDYLAESFQLLFANARTPILAPRRMAEFTFMNYEMFVTTNKFQLECVPHINTYSLLPITETAK